MHRLTWGLLLLMVCSCRGCSGQKEQLPALRTIAQLTGFRGEVKIRRAGEKVWVPARGGLELHPGDMVKTSEHASARISFVGGGAVDLEEISLLVVEGPASQPPGKAGAPPRVARVESGSIRGVSQPGAPALKVVTADGQSASIVADGKEPVPFRVRIGEQHKLEVAVLKGAARVEAGEGTQASSVKMTTNEVVDISRQQVSRPVRLLPFPELQSPGVDQSFSAGGPIVLKWSPVEGAAAYRVQISHSTSFESRLVDTRTRDVEWKLTRPKLGRPHVWRVASLDGAGHESEFGYARRFYVQPEEEKDKPEDEDKKAARVKAPEDGKHEKPGVKVPKTIRWK